MFRSKRSSLVKRLWKLCVPKHESNSTDEKESPENLEIKSIAQSMLKRLKESQLEMLIQALESKGGETTDCVLLPKGEQRLGKRTVDSCVLCCQLFRWSTALQTESQLKRLPCCTTDVRDPAYVCCNPYHWSLLLDPELPPIPGLAELGVHDLSERVPKHFGQAHLEPISTETGLTPTHYRQEYSDELSSTRLASSPLDEGGGENFFFNSSDMENGDFHGSDANHNHHQQHRSHNYHWCSIAYWELRQRVGRLYVVREPALNVFQRLPHGSGMCLEVLQTKTDQESVRKTREKIGLGLILSREGRSVWLYNRSQFPVFVNSPTLEESYCKMLVVWKVLPGYSIKIFDFDRLEAMERTRNTDWSTLRDGPYDPLSVRVSFAKGWGPFYSRQFVTSCPCWLEILLKEIKR